MPISTINLISSDSSSSTVLTLSQLTSQYTTANIVGNMYVMTADQGLVQWNGSAWQNVTGSILYLNNSTIAANTSADGLILIDTAAAIAGNQQFSPRIRLSGQGWKTASTAASQPVDWIVENQPVQGTTNPSTSLVFSRQINSGGYVGSMTLSNTAITIGNATDNPSFAFLGTGAIAGTQLNITSVSQPANTSVNGITLIDTTPATSGNQQFSPNIILSGQSWKTTATAASQQVDWKIENQTVQGTTTGLSNLVVAYQINGGGYTSMLTVNSSVSGLSINGTLGAASNIFAPSYFSSGGTSGLNMSGTNTILFRTASTTRGTLDANGVWNLGTGITQAANTSVVGLTLVDATAATSGNQQYSPAIQLSGQGWGTTAPASAQVDFKIEVQPVQGTTPTGNLIIASQFAGGGYTTQLQLSNGALSLGSSGTGTYTGNFNVNGSGAVSTGLTKPTANTLTFLTNSVARGNFDANGNFITLFAQADQSASVQTPSTGFTITIGNNISTLVLTPAGTLTTGTITMPATPIDKQIIKVCSTQIVTTLTVSPNSGQTINGAPTTITATAGFSYIYVLASTQWVRLY